MGADSVVDITYIVLFCAFYPHGISSQHGISPQRYGRYIYIYRDIYIYNVFLIYLNLETIY